MPSRPRIVEETARDESCRTAPGPRLADRPAAFFVATLRAVALSLARLGEEFFAIGEAVRLEEEAEQNCAVRRHRLVPIAGRPPDELARSAFAFVILERAFDHVGLLQCGVLVQRHDGAGRELEQCDG